MKYRVKDLEGKALDWAVAGVVGAIRKYPVGWYVNESVPLHAWSPSSSAVKGLALIEQHGIATWKYRDLWCATWPGEGGYPGDSSYIDVTKWDGETGPTLLIAAMRCLVRNLHGENEIEVPLL